MLYVHASTLSRQLPAVQASEQGAVLQFIDYLKGRNASAGSESPFLQAADEFIAKHPDLPQRLAQ
jgi:hypothetical protein